MGLFSTSNGDGSEVMIGSCWNDARVELKDSNATGVIPKPFAFPLPIHLLLRYRVPSLTHPSSDVCSFPRCQLTFFRVPPAGGFWIYAVVTLEMRWVGAIIEDATTGNPGMRSDNVDKAHSEKVGEAACAQN